MRLQSSPPVAIGGGHAVGAASLSISLTLLLVLAVCLWARVAPAQSYDQKPLAFTALTNSAQTIKASPGALLWFECFNPNASAAFVQFFDTAGAVTPGTTAPKFSWSIPATSSTGMTSPQISGPYFATAGMKALAATTAAGGAAPSSALSCDFGIR